MWLEANDRWLAWTGSALGVSDGKLAWARIYTAHGDSDTAARYAEDALRIARSPHRPLVLCQALRTVGELAAARREWALAIGHFDAALALAVRCEAPFERGRTELAIGELRIAEHRPADALPHLVQAKAIFSELAASPFLARIAKLSPGPVPAGPSVNPFGLTAREAEVLRLSAQGLTDAGVGQRLYISPRTVSQHLRSVYGKLGVSTRAAATRMAIEHGLA
jgi:DNA-binding CsgD family transcriptional regulator